MKAIPNVLACALSLALLASLSATAFAADGAASYSYSAPTSPMAVNDSVITASAHRGAAPLLDMLGLNAVSGYSMINGGAPNTLAEAEECAALGIWGTSINSNPDPYYWNLFYNFYAAENGLELSSDALINNSTVSGPAMADTFLYEEYGNISVSLYTRPDILVGCSGSSGALSGYDDQLATIASFYSYDENGNLVVNSDYYQPGDEAYAPKMVGFDATLIKQVIETVNSLAAAVKEVEKETGKVTRYDDVLEIAEDYVAYVYGLVAYVNEQMESGGIEQKTVAVLSSVNEDGTYTLKDTIASLAADGKPATSMTSKAYEYTMCVSKSLVDEVGSTVVTLDQLLTADAIVVDTDTCSYQDMLESFGEQSYSGLVVANVPATLYGIYHGSIESAMGYGYIIGCLYSDEIDNLDPVDLCAYFYQRFLHISDRDALETVIRTNFANVILPAGIASGISSTYSLDSVKEMLNQGMSYLKAHPEKFTDAEYELIGMTAGFDDVEFGSYYFDAAAWAADQGITAGVVNGSSFAPNDDCTRAETVTFLWNAAGCPEPAATRCAFTDIDENAYYYKAMLWAVENGITTGTGNGTTFSPDQTLTRAECMTFLYRCAGKPSVKSENTFSDVAADAYYANAVIWATENGITEGTGDRTIFSPDITCGRAQAVTFLYRYWN